MGILEVLFPLILNKIEKVKFFLEKIVRSNENYSREYPEVISENHKTKKYPDKFIVNRNSVTVAIGILILISIKIHKKWKLSEKNDLLKKKNEEELMPLPVQEKKTLKIKRISSNPDFNHRVKKEI